MSGVFVSVALRSIIGTAAGLALAGIVLAGCAGPEFRRVPTLDPAKLRSLCAVVEPPVTLDQARCIAGAAGLEAVEGAATIAEGTNLLREPVWIVQELCSVNPRCVEIWIRQADGAIVNTRYLYVFGTPADASPE